MMNKCNSIEAIDKTSLSEQTKFWLDEISKIENYFIEEINQRKSCSKKLNKYVAAFDYIDQALIVLSATSGGVSIISFTTIAGTPVGIASTSLTLFFSLSTGIVKKLLNKKKKRKNIKFLCWLKVNLIALNSNISSINWHAYKPWRICYNFERKRWIWKDERQFKKWKWRIPV